jgi:hypothetical protein
MVVAIANNFKKMTIMYLSMALFHAPAWCEKRVKKSVKSFNYAMEARTGIEPMSTDLQ